MVGKHVCVVTRMCAPVRLRVRERASSREQQAASIPFRGRGRVCGKGGVVCATKRRGAVAQSVGGNIVGDCW